MDARQKVLNHVWFVPQQSTDKIGDLSTDNRGFCLQVCTKPSNITNITYCYGYMRNVYFLLLVDLVINFYFFYFQVSDSCISIGPIRYRDILRSVKCQHEDNKYVKLLQHICLRGLTRAISRFLIEDGGECEKCIDFCATTIYTR